MSKQKPIDELHSDMTEQLDRALYDVLVNGAVAQDENGQAIRVTPSAAMFNVIRSRVRDIGMSSPKDNKAANSLVAEAQKRGLKYDGRAVPPLDEEGRDAATG